MKRLPLVADFVLFVVLCVSAAYWAMQLYKPAPRPVAAAPLAVAPEPRLDAAASLFGGRQAAVVASNYQLKGVVVAGKSNESIAILSADGKPAQAVTVNMEIAPGVTVQEVHPQYVLVAEGGVTKRVELPESAKSQGRMEGGNTIGAPVSMPTPVISLPNGLASPSPAAGINTAPPPGTQPSHGMAVPEAPSSGMSGSVMPGGGHPGTTR